MSTFGFIGNGNMGGALVKGACKKVDVKNVYLYDKSVALSKKLSDEYGCVVAKDSVDLAKKCDYIFLGVKPQVMKSALSDIKDALAERKDSFTLVTMAAGLSIDTIREYAGGDYPVIRIMPNTPVSVGEGMILYATTDNVSKETIDEFLTSMDKCGKFVKLAEGLIDAGSAVSGCGPAYVDLFLEALADGAVACGVPRKDAYDMAAQMVLGSAKLMLESGKHPGELKDAVCSPGGSTIQGVRVMEDGGFRGIVMEAVIAAFEKTKELGKK